MTTAGRDKASMAGAKRVVARQRRRQSGWRRLEQSEWRAAFGSGRRGRAAVAVAAGIPATAPPGRATHPPPLSTTSTSAEGRAGDVVWRRSFERKGGISRGWRAVETGGAELEPALGRGLSASGSAGFVLA
uniref:Uncharacterized protein n=1 Tax=Saccharum officinarum TaxID=4547 RepID=A0A678TAI3_SACOF|nr:hypothetical protein SO93O11_000010 [Saccharum officinarum]